MSELLYPRLSYQIIGGLYNVYNELSFGHREKVYQKAFEEELKLKHLPYKRELYFPICYNGKIISKYYYDFLIDDKIVIELKVANNFYQRDINQLLAYLKHNNFKLGILVLFTRKGLLYKRIANSRKLENKN